MIENISDRVKSSFVSSVKILFYFSLIDLPNINSNFFMHNSNSHADTRTYNHTHTPTHVYGKKKNEHVINTKKGSKKKQFIFLNKI